MVNSGLQTAMAKERQRNKSRQSSGITGGHRARLSRFLSPEQIESHIRRGADLRYTTVRTIICQGIYWSSDVICRYYQYLLFYPDQRRVELWIQAGTMAYSRQSAARLSSPVQQKRKKLSRINRPKVSHDSLDRDTIGAKVRVQCTHKWCAVETSSGCFAFYCKRCKVAWSSVHTYRWLYPTKL